MVESINRTIGAQVSLDKRQDPISTITRAEKVGGMAQMVEHETLNANSQYLKQKQQQKNS
jgi:hypothetical protein